MRRSLGSVYSGSVTRFLGGVFHGVKTGVIETPFIRSSGNGMAVSRDGRTLLVSDSHGGSHSVSLFNVADGTLVREVGGPGAGDGPLQFKHPCQVWVATDGFVFVSEYINNRVQVLTPTLDFHCFVGHGRLDGPSGVCANADVVVVSETRAHRISVFCRADGAALRTFGCWGSGDGELTYPQGLCFTSHDTAVAVADWGNDRVCLFRVDGTFLRRVGVGVVSRPHGVAASTFDDLVVADSGHRRVRVFGAAGDLLRSLGDMGVSGVAIHGCTVFAQDQQCRCEVWS
jgi:DNA-binding beta-propeller fold protein YncE